MRYSTISALLGLAMLCMAVLVGCGGDDNNTPQSSSQAPTMASFTPEHGGAGTTVTLTGTNFTGTTAVKFNGKDAASFEVVDAGTITTVVPTNTATGSISVTTPNGTVSSTTSFMVAPTITSITPASGSTTGGTTVFITGANFFGATALKFGSMPATGFLVHSDTLITATSPALPAGQVTISVTTPSGTGTSGTKFTTVSRPMLASITPQSGPKDGGTTVTLTGADFTGATAVKFGNVPAASFIVDNDTSITAVSPAGTDPVAITIVTPYGDTTEQVYFTYIP